MAKHEPPTTAPRRRAAAPPPSHTSNNSALHAPWLRARAAARGLPPHCSTHGPTGTARCAAIRLGTTNTHMAA
eukprot:7974389-Alexandrium_andersonii.AAC.1